MVTAQRKVMVKAICLFQQEDYIFVSKSYDKVENDYFYRPIGGTTEFGEYTKDTIAREIREELNVEITNVKLEKIIENIFKCDGIEGHEIVFLYKGDFEENKYYEIKEHEIIESNGERIPALWIKIEEFTQGRLRLVPEKLNEYITQYSK